jgi:hypothetical protein
LSSQRCFETKTTRTGICMLRIGSNTTLCALTGLADAQTGTGALRVGRLLACLELGRAASDLSCACTEWFVQCIVVFVCRYALHEMNHEYATASSCPTSPADSVRPRAVGALVPHRHRGIIASQSSAPVLHPRAPARAPRMKARARGSHMLLTAAFWHTGPMSHRILSSLRHSLCVRTLWKRVG